MTTPLYFDDYTTGIETYPDDNVTLQIADVTFPGSALNEHEEGTFDIQVTNNGPVTVADVRIRVKGLNGTLVRQNGAAAVFGSEFVTEAGQIPDVHHHESKQISSSPLKFKAPGPLPLSDLVEITFEDWRPDFEHINTVHTKATTKVSATYSDKVLRS